jgi:L-malate glycosyltransferase
MGIKICIIGPNLDSIGGQASQARVVLKRLKEQNIKVLYVAIDPSLEGIIMRLKKYRFIRTIVNSIAYFLTLIKVVPKIDIIHIFSASYSSFNISTLPAVLIGKLFNKRIIINYHSGEAQGHLEKSKRFIKKVFRNVERVVVPSMYLKDIFGNYGIKVDVVHNIVETQNFPFLKRDLFKPTFIIARNLEKIYNIECAIKAFKLIQNHFKFAQLTIAGDGKEREYLKKLVVHLGINNVEFVGQIEQNEISKYYREVDFMLNSSNIDNMPMSILEAFSSGIPIISTNAGGIGYMISNWNTGITVPLDDYKAMAEAALIVLKDQNLAQKISASAKAEVEKYYSWNENLKKWIAIYNQGVE